jgi:predicted flavoprotein YhiN
MTDLAPRTKDIAIIGGGPAGLMAAETLATLGHKVTVYDGMASVGRKFLLAGRGGLNLTHSEAMETFTAHYGESESWMKAVLMAFSIYKHGRVALTKSYLSAVLAGCFQRR